MRTILILLLAAFPALAQETAMARLKREASSFKSSAPDQFPARLANLHLALRDWIESRLPRTATSVGELKDLEAALADDLQAAGLSLPDALDNPGAGYVTVEFRFLPDLYDTLFVVAGATVECGSDQAVYLYHLEAHGRTRLFEDRPGTKYPYMDATLELSEPDADGRRLLVTHYVSAQCASTWMGLAYSAFRIGPGFDTAERLLTEDHDFWLGNDGPEYVVKPDELAVEFLDSSVDAGVHNRTRIHRYRFADGAHRIDPVAFQPQDFAEEWLTRPWSEMQSRSAAETREWHERLHADPIFAEYSGVAPCMARPGRWSIALEINHLGEKELEKPLAAWFLVQDLGDFHYRMEAVAGSAPEGCLAGGSPSDKHPWLSSGELRSLK